MSQGDLVALQNNVEPTTSQITDKRIQRSICRKITFLARAGNRQEDSVVPLDQSRRSNHDRCKRHVA